MCKLVLEIRSELTAAIPTMSLRHVLFLKVTCIFFRSASFSFVLHLYSFLLFSSLQTNTKIKNKGHTVHHAGYSRFLALVDLKNTILCLLNFGIFFTASNMGKIICFLQQVA